jgi:hypothetical protein
MGHRKEGLKEGRKEGRKGGRLGHAKGGRKAGRKAGVYEGRKEGKDGALGRSFGGDGEVTHVGMCVRVDTVFMHMFMCVCLHVVLCC